ncbi:hypothetical protein [Streptomyces brevispora]
MAAVGSPAGRTCDALAVFDAEHPQIIAALHEQEAADVRRRAECD